MKNALIMTLCLLVVLASYCASAYGGEFKIAPLNVDGTVMVSVAEVCGLAKGALQWDSVAQKAILTAGDKQIELTIGDKAAHMAAGEKMMTLAPMLNQGRMMVAVRFLVSELGGTLEYTPRAKMLTVQIMQDSLAGKVQDLIRPTIRITIVPPHGGGADTWGRMAGVVKGITNPEQYRVVVYAITDQWYVQPWTVSPFTKISKNGKWKTGTHLGWEYCALLVKPGYSPESVRSCYDEPEVGGEILAMTRVDAR